MKKYIVLLITIIMFCIPKVNASSIVYNLEIDNNMEFHEKIVYTINNSDINNNSYNFLSSVLNDRIYFDTNKKVPYTKTRQRTSNGYIVTLKHNYYSLFFIKSRIASECFNDIKLYNDENGLKFTSSTPFFCSHRADNIVINITSAQKITKSNADAVNGQTYTWNNIGEDFRMEFSTRPTEVTDTPMDDGNQETDTNENKTNTNKSSISPLTKRVIVLSALGLIVFIFVIALVLKRKKEELDKF